MHALWYSKIFQELRDFSKNILLYLDDDFDRGLPAC